MVKICSGKSLSLCGCQILVMKQGRMFGDSGGMSAGRGKVGEGRRGNWSKGGEDYDLEV